MKRVILSLASAATALVVAISGSTSAAASTDKAERDKGATDPQAMTSVYETDVDYPHRSDGDVSSHGWWNKLGGTAKLARVQMELYAADGGWKLMKYEPFSEYYSSGGGRGNRQTIRYACGTRQGPYLWQSYAEADIAGEADPVQWATRGQVAVACSPRI